MHHARSYHCLFTNNQRAVLVPSFVCFPLGGPAGASRMEEALHVHRPPTRGLSPPHLPSSATPTPHGATPPSDPHQAYFNEALLAMQRLETPPLLTNNVGGSVPASALRGAYTHKVAISADRFCRLAEVTSCWARTVDGRAGEQLDCPEHVMRRDNQKCDAFVVTALGVCMSADAKKGAKKAQR